MKGRGKRKTGTERTRTAAAKQRKVAERQRNKGRDEQVARTMVGGEWGGEGTGDEVGKDGVWMESRGEDRREEEEEVAMAGRVSVCKRFLRRGD